MTTMKQTRVDRLQALIERAAQAAAQFYRSGRMKRVLSSVGLIWVLLFAAPALAATRVVDFNDHPANTPLTGEYPAGVIDWGSSGWFASGPYGAFTTGSVSFTNGPTAGNFSFRCACWLASVDAYNGGAGVSTVSLACSGQPALSRDVAPGSLVTLTTPWAAPCATVTIGSSNGWDTNFDDLTYEASAQTSVTVLDNPIGEVTFTVTSADHAATVTYEGGWFLAGASAPVQQEALGKPTPDATSKITAQFNSRPAFGTYRVRVRALGTVTATCPAPCASAWGADAVWTVGTATGSDVRYGLLAPTGTTIRE